MMLDECTGISNKFFTQETFADIQEKDEKLTDW